MCISTLDISSSFSLTFCPFLQLPLRAGRLLKGPRWRCRGWPRRTLGSTAARSALLTTPSNWARPTSRSKSWVKKINDRKNSSNIYEIVFFFRFFLCFFNFLPCPALQFPPTPRPVKFPVEQWRALWCSCAVGTSRASRLPHTPGSRTAYSWARHGGPTPPLWSTHTQECWWVCLIREGWGVCWK